MTTDDPGPVHRALGSVEDAALPAWRRVTDGEARWPVTLATATAIVLQVLLPEHLTLGSNWMLPLVEGLIMVGLTAVNPRISRHSSQLRYVTLVFIAIMTFSNTWSAVHLVQGLLRGTDGADAAELLRNGGAIWLTNVVVFALWYWEFDRGGPGRRAQGVSESPDFVFPQMLSPGLAAKDWEPGFVDYFYLSFTNATAFSPTDTMPFSPWAKLTMLAQSAVSLSTVAVVIARAVNTLNTVR